MTERLQLWSCGGGRQSAGIAALIVSQRLPKPDKLSEFCSGEWKREVSLRWAAERAGWKEQGVDNWVGISLDEKGRRRAPRRLWYQPTYPLLDIAPMGVAGCLAAVARIGWPEPPRSRCFHCPNQSDAEWLELTPEEFDLACKRDEWLRETDPHVFLHRQMIPLRQVTLRADDSMFTGGCSAGTCY
jgi:hypothetical protein